MKPEEFWDLDTILKDLLFESNLSIQHIADELDLSVYKVNQRIKQLGLGWVRRNNRKLSRGHAALTQIMQKLLVGEKVINEHHIGERLMLDIYCDSYKLAAEYHGRQHFEYSNLFHKDRQDFLDGQARDERKVELCKEQGIALIVFRYNDELTEEAVYDRMMEAIRKTPYKARKKTAYKLSPNSKAYYESAKIRQQQYRKQKYQELKKRRNGN